MTIPLISKPAFPSVPDVAGVPPIPRSSSEPPPTTTYATADAKKLPVNRSEKLWGIYTQANALALTVDTIESVKPKNDCKVSSFPVEDGGFVSFNKVDTPYEVKVKISSAGSVQDMSNLLDDLANMLASVDFFSVVTPFEVYENATLKNYDYSQESKKGANCIHAELTFGEVREVTPQFTTVSLPAAKVKNPSSASASDSGKKQAKPGPSLAAGKANKISAWAKT